MRVPPPGWRGNQMMISKVLAFAEDAPRAQPPPSRQVETDRQVAARLKRERRNAKRVRQNGSDR